MTKSRKSTAISTEPSVDAGRERKRREYTVVVLHPTIRFSAIAASDRSLTCASCAAFASLGLLVPREEHDLRVPQLDPILVLELVPC